MTSIAAPLSTLLLAMLLGIAQAEDSTELAQLMQRMAMQRHGHAHFVERTYLRILQRPLESRGELFYEAPDRLEKRTLEPKPESLVLDQGKVTIHRGRRQYQLSLHDFPQLIPFIDSIRATLAGDLATLQRVYVVNFIATNKSWTLTLVPRDPQLAQLIQQIRIAGLDERVTGVEIVHRDGDRSELSIQPIATE